MEVASTLQVFVLALLMTTLVGFMAYVEAPPPPHPVKVRPAIPFATAVWIDGHYAYRRGRYVWVPGGYVRAPHPRAHWVPGRWKKHRRGWKWNEGALEIGDIGKGLGNVKIDADRSRPVRQKISIRKTIVEAGIRSCEPSYGFQDLILLSRN
jgi:hypothetical protein